MFGGAAGDGTVDSRHDFDRHFRPTTNRVRSRWEQLALAQRRGAAIPPIEVYRIATYISSTTAITGYQ